MTTQTTHEVEYTGYDPRSGRCSFSVPAGWGTGIPIANARLIAAAPELLEALEALFTEAGEHAIDCGIEFAALAPALTAITKARGQ